MTRMKIPAIDDLTSEQDRILRLPDLGRFFIGGPPGTGKTVVALLRAHAMTLRKNRPTVIMFNRLLEQYCREWLASRQLNLGVSTYHNWFRKHYRQIYGEKPPNPADTSGSGNTWVYDWNAIEDTVAKNPPKRDQHPLIIDEGQDLPRAFYQYVGLHFSNIMVFADENQMLNEKENSTKEEIWSQLNIPEKHRIDLIHNHRNSLEVARVSQHFYAGTDSGIPELPTRKGPYPPLLIDYRDIKAVTGYILRFAKNHPHALVGVMTASNHSQDTIRAHLEPECRKAGILFSWYRLERRPFTFNNPGIVLLNLQSTKGLEFDAVFIPDLHKHWFSPGSQSHLFRLYVATSRARDALYLLSDRESQCPVRSCMPAEEILGRRSLLGEGEQS